MHSYKHIISIRLQKNKKTKKKTKERGLKKKGKKNTVLFGGLSRASHYYQAPIPFQVLLDNYMYN